MSDKVLNLKKKNGLWSRLGIVLLCISGAVLSRLLAFPQTVENPLVSNDFIQGPVGIAIGCIAAVLFWLCVSRKTKLFETRPDKIILLLSGLTALITVRKGCIDCGFPVIYSAISLIAVWAGIYLVAVFIRKLYQSLTEDKDDRKFLIIASLAVSAAVIIFYSASDRLYQQYDLVYSMDGGWVFNNMYPMLNYYDVRHPVISIFYYPIYCFCFYFLKVFHAYSVTGLAILLQMVHVQMWLLTALLLSHISGNKWVKYLYLASGPVMLFMFFFEKFAILVFLLVLTVYLIKQNNPVYIATIAAASGSILTSCVIAAGILFIRKVSWKDKWKAILKAVVFTIIFFIAFGRLGTVLNGLPEAEAMKGFLGQLTVRQKLYSYLNMIGSSLISISPDIQADRVWWLGLTDTFNIVGFLSLIMCVYMIIKDRNRIDIQISTGWMIFSFVLVFFAGWSISESPLFAVYFSWALILIGSHFLERLLTHFCDEKRLYLTVIITIAALNLSTTLPVIFAAMRLV